MISCLTTSLANRRRQRKRNGTILYLFLHRLQFYQEDVVQDLQKNRGLKG